MSFQRCFNQAKHATTMPTCRNENHNFICNVIEILDRTIFALQKILLNVFRKIPNSMDRVNFLRKIKFNFQ